MKIDTFGFEYPIDIIGNVIVDVLEYLIEQEELPRCSASWVTGLRLWVNNKCPKSELSKLCIEVHNYVTIRQLGNRDVYTTYNTSFQVPGKFFNTLDVFADGLLLSSGDYSVIDSMVYISEFHEGSRFQIRVSRLRIPWEILYHTFTGILSWPNSINLISNHYFSIYETRLEKYVAQYQQIQVKLISLLKCREVEKNQILDSWQGHWEDVLF